MVNTKKVEPHLISKNSEPAKTIQYFTIKVSTTHAAFSNAAKVERSRKSSQLLDPGQLDIGERDRRPGSITSCQTRSASRASAPPRWLPWTRGPESEGSGSNHWTFLFRGLGRAACLLHLEGFAHSNDAVQMAAEVAQHTISTSHWDFLFADIYLFLQGWAVYLHPSNV